MFIDSQNQYSAAQALSATGLSTNLIDHGVDGDIGIGEPMALVLVVTGAASATNGNETYSAQLQVDSSSGFGSASAVGQAITIPRGTAAGTKFVAPLPPDTSWKQFSTVSYTLGGTSPAVSVSAFLQPMSMIQNNNVYKDALVIL